MKQLKTIMILTALMAMGLTGCNKSGTSAKDSTDSKKEFATSALNLKIAAPAGSPAVSLFAHLKENNVEINSADSVQAYMTDTSDKDIVILPTNYGINMIVNSHVSFKIAATVTFGNFYLLSTGLDDDNTLDENDKVLAFQQKGVAGKLFNYLYGDKQLDVTYLADAKAVKTEVLTPTSTFDYDYVLLAQPVVNAILKTKSAFAIYANIQQDYKTKTGGKEITQASIFVKNSVDVEKAKADLATIKNDVTALLEDSQLIIDQTSNLESQLVAGKFTASAEDVKGLLDNGNQLGVGYKDAFENKANIDSFISTLGLGATSEDIYFRA